MTILTIQHRGPPKTKVRLSRRVTPITTSESLSSRGEHSTTTLVTLRHSLRDLLRHYHRKSITSRGALHDGKCTA